MQRNTNNEIIRVKVIEKVMLANGTFYKVKYEDELLLTKCFSWQLMDNYKAPGALLCYRDSIGTEKNTLIQVGGEHLVHPTYELEGEYPFLVVSINKIMPYDNEIKLLLRGQDNIDYSIHYFTSRFDNFEKDKEIICKYQGITKSGDLRLIPRRKFFSIEDVLGDLTLAKAAFYSLENYSNPITKKLSDEYNKKENIWILTYCNFLSEKIYELLNNFAFTEASLFVDAIIATEDWVLHSGFLTSFNTENRKNSKLKAESAIEKFSVIKEFIFLVVNMEFSDFIKTTLSEQGPLTKKQFELVYLLSRFGSKSMVDNSIFIKIIQSLEHEQLFNEDYKFRYVKLISTRKKELRKQIYMNAESNLEVNIDFFYDKSLLRDLIPLTFYESLLLKELNRIDEFKHARTSFVKQCAYIVEYPELKKALFRTAILLANKDKIESDDAFFNWGQKQFNQNTIENILKSYDHLEKEQENISELLLAKYNNDKLNCTIIGKYENGFQIEYKGFFGILLFREVDLSFKYNVGDKIDAYILEYEEFSEEFFATTIHAAIDFYMGINNNFDWNKFWDYDGLKSHLTYLGREQFEKIQIGDVLYGNVKNITEYGAFITLGFVDALLHKDEIKWGYISNVSDELKLYQELKIVVISKNNSQLNVSLKQLLENPWNNIENLKVDDILKATICRKTDKGYIVELENKLLGFLNKDDVHGSSKLYPSDEIKINDVYFVKIKKIVKHQRRVFVVDPQICNVEQIEKYDTGETKSELIETHEKEQSLRNISFEKSFIIENHALTIPNIDNKLNLLKWVKLYTILYPTRKKYLIELYIMFYNALKLFYDKEDINNLREFFGQLEHENVFNETMIAFPHAKKLLEIIEVLTLFGKTENKTISILSNIIVSSETNTLISNLSKLILSANLMYSITRENRYWKLSQKQIYKFLEDGFLDFYFNYDESDKELIEEQKISAMIEGGETDTVEFKSTLLYDVKDRKINRLLEKEVLKTIVAFLNTKGGTLFIGIEDNGDIYGLTNDLNNVPGSAKEPKDRFLLHLDSLINTNIGKEFNVFVEVSFRQMYKKEICKIIVTPSKSPAFLSYKKSEEEFFVRNKAQSCKLTMSEMAKYLNERSDS